MKLKNLKIELQPYYSKNAGKYEAEIAWENEKGEVKMQLDSKISEALLAFIGPTLTKFSHQAALEIERGIVQSVQESKQSPAIEAPKV